MPSTPQRSTLETRRDLRNVAIVAHVDHGKTTLVDAMLRQTGAFRANQPWSIASSTRATSSARRASRSSPSRRRSTTADVRLNIVDTPGHADFGGEVERSLLMVDSVLLLVDAAEARCRRRATCSRRRWRAACPWSSRSTRSTVAMPGRPRSLDDVYELFIDLGADEHQIEFPVVYTNAKAAPRRCDLAEPGTDLRPLLDLLVEVTPPPDLRAGSSAPASRYQPVGERVRRAHGRRPDPQRDDPHGPAHPVVREEPDDTAGSVRAGPDRDADRHGHPLQTAHGIERVDIAGGRPGRDRRRSPACPRSPSATRSPIRPTRGHCRDSMSTRRRCA